jgi:SAM-dependent methyltransferase
MDVIYLSERTEDLNPRQIRRVNRLRRPLIDDDTSAQHATNQRVKAAMAAAVSSTEPTSVLDWGCGYHPIRTMLDPRTKFIGIDIDSDVIAHNIRNGIACVDADDVPKRLAGMTCDAIVSVFVFHFRLPHQHIESMVDAIGDAGYILANVYRRGAESRHKLTSVFEEHGLEVLVERDPTESATGNEFWFIARPARAAAVGRQVLDTAVAKISEVHRAAV